MDNLFVTAYDHGNNIPVNSVDWTLEYDLSRRY